MINLFRVRQEGFNVGNSTIDLASSRMLRAAFGPGANLIPIPASATQDDAGLSGMTARGVHEYNQHGHGVVIGGGNMYENGRLDIDVNALRCLAPPLLLWSLSFGRIYDRTGRLRRRTDSMPDELILALNASACESLARDAATAAHLRRVGVRGAAVGGCPTLFLDELLHPAPPSAAGTSGTLISVRHPSLMSIPHSRQVQIHTLIGDIAETLDLEGLGPVRLLCHDRRDLGFAASFGRDYLLPEDVWAHLELLRQATAVVCLRLHAFLPCLSFQTPAVSISYDERSSSLISTIGLGDWDINLIDDEDVVGSVLDRIRRLEDLTRLVADARGVWEGLRAEMGSALERFAEEVLRYAASGAPAWT